jgi:hypothetical protein
MQGQANCCANEAAELAELERESTFNRSATFGVTY